MKFTVFKNSFSTKCYFIHFVFFVETVERTPLRYPPIRCVFHYRASWHINIWIKPRHRITTIVLIMMSCNPSFHNHGCRQFRRGVWGLCVDISNGEIATTALSIHIFISDSSYLLGCQALHNE